MSFKIGFCQALQSQCITVDVVGKPGLSPDAEGKLWKEAAAKTNPNPNKDTHILIYMTFSLG